MPFISNIVAYINESLKSSLSDKRFQPGRFVGVTTQLPRIGKNDKLELLPAECDISGNYKTVEPDDRYPLSIYHKTLSNAYGFAKKSYGNDLQQTCTTEMQAVIFADSRKIKMKADRLEPLIIYGLPQRLSSALQAEIKFSSFLITPVSSNMDKVSVFRQEYPQSEYFLKPFHELFSIRYRIDAGFDKACIDQCLCGE